MTTTITKEHCNKARPDGVKNDCGLRALACALQLPYSDIVAQAKEHSAYRPDGGLAWHGLPAIVHGAGKSLVTLVDDDHAPTRHTIAWHLRNTMSEHGTYIVHQRGHLFCVRGGEIQDWMAAGRRHQIKDIWQVVHHAGLSQFGERLERTIQRSAVRAGV